MKLSKGASSIGASYECITNCKLKDFTNIHLKYLKAINNHCLSNSIFPNKVKKADAASTCK